MLITTHKEANQLQSSCISLPTATVPALYSVANQVLARDMHLSCVACVCYPACAPKPHATVCAHASF